MKIEDFKVGKYYLAQWKSDPKDFNPSFFKGVVKMKKVKPEEAKNYSFVEIIRVFETSTDAWHKGFEFFLTPDQISNEISEEDYPEYFI